MDSVVPRPGSWIKKEDPKPVIKRPFVRKPHLTNKPFDNPAMKDLQKNIVTSKTKKRS